jgi:murein tripeptide amidase MpaA
VIIVTARTHPGETVGSLMMEGFLKKLSSSDEDSNYLKKRFLIKVLPMLNVDGVVNGNFRFGASGNDLNRRWENPSEQHHPEVYYLKEMILRENR